MHAKINPIVVLIIGLPLFAVLASVGTAVLAFTRGDPVLPDEYHWEGQTLDHDFALSERAVQLKVSAALHLEPVAGVCHLTLRLDGSLPPAVDVSLTHVSQPALDRRIRFTRTAQTSSYSARCSTLPAAQWHVELRDVGRSWSFRDEAAGRLATVNLPASSTEGRVAWP